MRVSTALLSSALLPGLLLAGVGLPGASGATSVAAGPRLTVSRQQPVAGTTITVKARVGAVPAKSCTLSARRVTGKARRALGRAPITSGVARWRVSTTGWSTGGWRLRAECRSLVVTHDVKVVSPPGPPPASDHFTRPSVTTVPALTPAYSPTVADYVVRCTAGVPVQVDVETVSGTYASIDRGRWRAGSVSAEVTLQPGQRFLLKVAGGAREETASIRCLPDDFPTLEASGNAPGSWYGFTQSYLSGSPYVIIVDARGTPVWWYEDTEVGNPADLRFWTSDELADLGWRATTAVSWATGRTYVLQSLGGRELHRWGAGLDLDRHDLVPTTRGTVLVIRYVKRNCPAQPAECVDMTAYGGSSAATVEDAEILELDKKGRVVWSWRSRDHIAISESQRALDHPSEPTLNADGSWDLVHMNSVEPVRGGVMFSARYLDAVYRISRATGEVTWKIGGTPTSASLQVLGDDVAYPLGMAHDARVGPDGVFSVFDNAMGLGRQPRVVRFKVDAASMTATVQEVLRDPLVPNANFAGSARPLSSGGWVVAWGGTNRISVYDTSGQPVLTILGTLPNGDKGITYRAVPMAVADLPATTLRQGMDRMHPRG